jgi:hypothetical protein
MPRRPRGQKSRYEAGLRELAKGRGPNLRRLENAIVDGEDTTAGLSELVSGTESMPNATPTQRAQALWSIIEEEIEKRPREDPKCHAALRAAFRIDAEAYRGAEYDTIEARLKRAKANGGFGPPGQVGQDAHTRAWGNGVFWLARRVEERLRALARNPLDWQAYLSHADTAPLVVPPPPTAQPVRLDQLRATYMMKQRAVDYTIVERLVTAQRDGVDRYIVRAGSPVSRPDRVSISPLLNCRAETVRSVPDGRGGRTHEVAMLFPDSLRFGEQCFFATQVTQQRNEDPIVEIQVTSHGIVAGGLTMRVQFDEGAYPVAAWWFGDCIDAERLDKPPDGHPRRLAWSKYGFLQHTFAEFCKPLAKYGIGWEWGER